jgi:hypothetical protein
MVWLFNITVLLAGSTDIILGDVDVIFAAADVLIFKKNTKPNDNNKIDNNNFLLIYITPIILILMLYDSYPIHL